MATQRHSWIIRILFFLGLIGGMATAAVAQETSPPSKLFITATTGDSLPTVELRVYGLNSFGEPLDLSGRTLTVQHNGTPADPIIVGNEAVGTFTLFLLDITDGLQEQIPAIQEAITQYASPANMTEQLDAIAIYQIGESGAVQLLPPDKFYNSILNLFASGIAPAGSTTTLLDSTYSLLEQIESLKPNPAMAPAIVLISDGTDAISTEAQFEDVANRAATLGIPIHTIHVDNPNLAIENQEAGRDNMLMLATNTRALAENLSKPTDLALIWNRIASFRSQTRLQYAASDLSAGTAKVVLSLTADPTIQAETAVEVPGNIPNVTLDIAAEDRLLTLSTVDNPVSLRLSGSVRWLDGGERQLTAAQLTVNGTVVADIDVAELTNFTVEIPNLAFGNNNFQLVVLDDQEVRAQSPTVILLVNEGPQQIPENLQPTLLGNGRLLRGILLFLLALGLLGGILFWGWRQGWLGNLGQMVPRGRSRVRRGGQAAVRGETAVGRSAPNASPSPPIYALARLELLESTTPMPAEIVLTAATIRLGRSPAQCDIAFEQDITVSRQHATLLLEGTHYRIYDQNSTSGTWVNEQRVPDYGTQLRDGDEVHLGAVHLRYHQP